MTNPGNRNKLSQLAASRLGARLFRVSVGLFWSGDAVKFDRERTITVNPGDVLIRKARAVHSGVTGMSDETGFVPVTITPEMVGTQIARYLAVEDKTGKGRSTSEQKAFIKMVRAFGGLAGVARSDEDVAAIIKGETRD